MASRSSHGEDDPDATDTREYSDYILYYVRNGRFQCHSLLDVGRQQGLISFLREERVTQLTLERRLSPLLITLTPGVPPQRVYMVGIVRSSKLY